MAVKVVYRCCKRWSYTKKAARKSDDLRDGLGGDDVVLPLVRPPNVYWLSAILQVTIRQLQVCVRACQYMTATLWRHAFKRTRELDKAEGSLDFHQTKSAVGREGKLFAENCGNATNLFVTHCSFSCGWPN